MIAEPGNTRGRWEGEERVPLSSDTKQNYPAPCRVHPITIRVSGPSRTRSRRKLSGASATQPAVGRNPGRAKCRKTALPRPGKRGRALWWRPIGEALEGWV